MCSVGSIVSQRPSRFVAVCRHYWFTPTPLVVSSFRAFSFVWLLLQLETCAVLLLNLCLCRGFWKIVNLGPRWTVQIWGFVFCDWVHATISVFVSIMFGAFLQLRECVCSRVYSVLVMLCLVIQISLSVMSMFVWIINNESFFVLVNGAFLSGVCSASSPPVCVFLCCFFAAGLALSSGSGGWWWSETICDKRCADIAACIPYKTELTVCYKHERFITTM